MFSVITLAVELVIKAFLNELTLGSGKTEAIDIAFIGLFSLAFMYDLGRSKKLKSLSFPLSLGYIFRVALLFFDRYGQNIYRLPNSGADSEMFYRTSSELATVGYTNRSENFITFVSNVFKCIGTSRLFGQFILLLFSILSLILFCSLLQEVEIDNHVRNTVCMVVCLLPNLAILSSIFLRESIVAMFITISFYLFYKWMNGKGNIFFIFSFVSAFYASYFHSGSAAVAIGYIAVVLLYDRGSKTFRFRGKNLIPAILLIAVVAFLYINYGGELFGKMQNVENIDDVANTSDLGGSSYVQYVGNSSNPISMIIFTPLRIVFFLFSPFPWQWRGLSDIIAFFFSSLFFLYTAWCDIRFLKSGEKKNRTLVIALTIVAACTAFVFAWGVSNTGTACRHRDKMTIIWGFILALTFDRKRALDCRKRI